MFELAGADRDDIRLSIDGMERALPPFGPVELSCKPGSHRVTATRSGYQPFVTEITLDSHERHTLVPKWNEPTQLVLVWPKPEREGAQVFLDGRRQELALSDLAASDTIVLPVDPGNRIVRIERPEFDPFETESIAKSGESTDVVVTFTKAESHPQPSDLAQNPDPDQKPEPSAPLEPEEMEATPPTTLSDAASLASDNPPPQVEPTPTDTVPSLLPIPTSDEQTLVLASVDEAFKVEEADTREKKVELAQKLLAVSSEARSTPLDQFGILQRGQQLAVAAEDVLVAMKFVAAKSETFEIDLLAEQAAILTQIADSAIETSVIDSLVPQGWKVLDAAVAAHRYDVVGDVIDAFHAEIRRKPWQSHAKQIADRHEELAALLKQWQSVQKALVSLEANPEDPAGNALVGRWYLDVGEPEKAFPYMAKIQHEAISSLAMSELTPPELAESQAALGDRWWDQAEEATDSALEKIFRDRAIYWYKRARPKLNSVVRIEKISNRLGEVTVPSSGVASQSEPGVLPHGKAIQKDKWEDLLAAIDLLRDVTRGRWQRQGPMIVSAAPSSMLMFPVAVHGDYELEFQFSVAGRSPRGLSVTIPVGSRTCNLFFAYNNQRDILTNVNGQPHIASVPRLVAGQPVTATVRVTTQDKQKHIDVSTNGSPYFHWQGAEASLSGTGTGQLPRMNQPGVVVAREQYALHAARFRMLEGEARLIVDKELPPQPYLFTGDVGHFQGTVFQEFAPSGSGLVGLRYTPGALGVGDLQPVYRDKDGQLQDGTWVGGTNQPAGSVVAKKGYAIGALEIGTQNGYLKGVTVRFYRLGEDGLDLADSYDSPLIGVTGTDGLSVVETRGRPATGIHGLWNPGQITSLGLVTSRPAEEDLWKRSSDGRSQYLPLLDLEPVQCTVGALRYSRRLGVGTTDPDAWPIIDEDSQPCPEYLYAPAPSRFIWKLTPATMKSFSAIGYCVEGHSVQFVVLVDGTSVYDSGEARFAEIRVDLPPGVQLELQVHTIGGSTNVESYWLFPRVHSRPAAAVKEFDEKTGRGSKLVGRPPLSQATDTRKKSHTRLQPLYPVTGHCREFLYAHPPSRVVYRVPAGAKRFSAIPYCADSKAVRFRVSVNGKEVSTSGPLGIERVQFTLPRHAKTIELWTDPVPENRRARNDHSFWCFPRFYK